MPRVFVTAALLVLLQPGAAPASDRFVARDEPVGAAAGARTGQAREAPLRFNMVGLHWVGAGTVSFRTAPKSGPWGAWREAEAEVHDGPDAGSKEGSGRAGWRLGRPHWTGSAARIQYRVQGAVRRLRGFFLWSDPELGTDGPARLSAPATGRARDPDLITRRGWGADESIVRDTPSVAERVRFAVVHHTAGANGYGRSEAAAVVRGIQRYHVLANGWDDIGYNFLVDRFGRVYEGRGGGVDRNVVGAHAQGFNTGSVGVAVLGTYSAHGVSPAAFAALRNLLAWRLDVAHVDPSSRVRWTSLGNPRYPAGTRVRLRAVSGHRDTGETSCPGGGLYGQLGALAASAAARGLPKLYDPEVTGGLGGPVRVTGRLSAERPWTVTIRDSGGSVVATGSGDGTAVDWTWDASAHQFGSYTYTVQSGPDVRSWTAAVPGPPELTLGRVSAPTLTPNGDGNGDVTSVAVTVSIPAELTVVIETLGGGHVRTLASNRDVPAGRTALSWDGRDGGGALVPEGRYRVQAEAESPGQAADAVGEVVVDGTLGGVSATAAAFSPNGDGRADGAAVGFTLSRPATVQVRVRRGGRTVATLRRSALPAGTHEVSWSGRSGGRPLPDGRYYLRVDARTSLGRRAYSVRVVLDTRRPGVSIAKIRRLQHRTNVLVRLSEPATVTLWWGRRTWRGGGTQVAAALPAGTSQLRLPGRPREIRAVARDPAGNKSFPDVRRA